MDKIIVVDFGSQYNQLIARRIRELGVYSEIIAYNAKIEDYIDDSVKGIILSGGPKSVYDDGAPTISKEIYGMGIPILGICYGMQLTQLLFKGMISPSNKREYGKSILSITKDSKLTFGIEEESTVWMSHGDHVDELSKEFIELGKTDSCIAIAKHKELEIYNLQFFSFTNFCKFNSVRSFSKPNVSMLNVLNDMLILSSLPVFKGTL